MAMLEFDEHATRQIQRLYSTPDVVEQREQVLALLSPQPGERILDVGSGPGFLVASMADAVGNRGAVHGLDPSTPDERRGARAGRVAALGEHRHR